MRLTSFTSALSQFRPVSNSLKLHPSYVQYMYMYTVTGNLYIMTGWPVPFYFLPNKEVMLRCSPTIPFAWNL